MTEPLAPVMRVGRDRFELHLDAQERRILGSLVGELRMELDDPRGSGPDGALARLYPPAFPDDPDAEASYADLVHADLVDGRRARVALVEATLDADALDETQASAWLTTLNDARLVLGASLGVTEDDDGRMPGPGEPDGMRMAVFAYLGWLVAGFTDALAEGLPPVPRQPAGEP